MSRIRDEVWESLHSTAHLPTPERVDALVRLVNNEKTKSYNVGFLDGSRHHGTGETSTLASHQ